jgi:hypothetical protein
MVNAAQLERRAMFDSELTGAISTSIVESAGERRSGCGVRNLRTVTAAAVPVGRNAASSVMMGINARTVRRIRRIGSNRSAYRCQQRLLWTGYSNIRHLWAEIAESTPNEADAS